MENKLNIVFLGSANFSVPILKELIENFNVLAVVTEADKPVGRGGKIESPPTKILASEKGIPIFQPESLKENNELYDQIKGLNPDLFVVAAYGKILPAEFLNLSKHGCLNVHPSLLPKLRGASPIQTALAQGLKITGTTIMLMDEGMDTGDLIAQESLEIDNNDYDELEARLASLSAVLLLRVMSGFADGTIKLHVQDEDEATYCYKIKKEDGEIDWNEENQVIANKVRAFVNWPVSHTIWNNKKLDIYQVSPVESIEIQDVEVGQVAKYQKKYFVRCGKGFLQLLKVKLEGKKEMNINDFVNGHQAFVGAILS